MISLTKKTKNVDQEEKNNVCLINLMGHILSTGVKIFVIVKNKIKIIL